MKNIKVVLKNNIRIYVTDSTEIIKEGLKNIEYSPYSALIFAKGVSTFLPFLAMKDDRDTYIEYKTEGPMRRMLIEKHGKGNIRALLANRSIATEYDNDMVKLNSVPLQIATGQQGQLKIVSFVNKQSFGGEVEIKAGDFVTDLAHYLDQSEQIFSAVVSSTAIDKGNRVLNSYGAIFQLLPDHTKEDVEWIRSFVHENPISDFDSIDEFIKKIDGKIIEEKEYKWKCKCDEKKLQSIFDSISQEERHEIIKKHKKLEITCEFCNKTYDFTNKAFS